MQDPALRQELNVRQLQLFDVRVLLTLLIHPLEEYKDLVHSFVVAAEIIDFDGDVKLGLVFIHCGLAVRYLRV